MAYIDKDFISANLFNGEMVPGPNTISEKRFDGMVTRVTSFINNFIRTTADVEDQGDLAEISLSLFKQALQNQELELSKNQKIVLRNRYWNKAPWSGYEAY